MPPKRKAPPSTSRASPPTTSAGNAPTKARASKLAKEHRLTAEEETEIQEAWSLFCVDLDELQGDGGGDGEDLDEEHGDGDVGHDDEEEENERAEEGGLRRKRKIRGSLGPSKGKSQAKGKGKSKVKLEESVMRTVDVRRALIALNIAPSPAEHTTYLSILDPDSQGYTTYPHFLAICALKLRSIEHSSESHRDEVDAAWALFRGSGLTNNDTSEPATTHDHDSSPDDERITLTTLRRIAAALKDPVADDVLKDMLLEANGGAGVSRGVSKSEFESVMGRAGVWR